LSESGILVKLAGLIHPESEMAYKLSKNRKIDSVEPLCRKKTYNSPEEAQEMIRQIMETRVTRAIHFYQCPVCGLWHLTSRREK